MEWQYLEYFRVAARLQHITQAAKYLGVTQPALTRAIFRLERQLGVQLFHHAGRTTELTSYGRAFVPRVERALKELDEAQREFADLAGHGAALLGSLRTLGSECVPLLLKRFSATNPGMRFTLMQGRPSILLEKLETGEISLALTVRPQEGSPVEWQPAFQQELVVIVPPTHRLAERRSIRLQELADEVIICYQPGNSVREVISPLCRQAGFEPKIMFESEHSSNIRGLVAAGVGVAFVPAMASEWQLPSLRISNLVAQRAIGVASLNGRALSSAERDFRDFVVATSEISIYL